MLQPKPLSGEGSNMSYSDLANVKTEKNVISSLLYEPVHDISNNLVCATSKGSDQPAHTRSLIRAFASRLSIL